MVDKQFMALLTSYLGRLINVIPVHSSISHEFDHLSSPCGFFLTDAFRYPESCHFSESTSMRKSGQIWEVNAKQYNFAHPMIMLVLAFLRCTKRNERNQLIYSIRAISDPRIVSEDSANFSK